MKQSILISLGIVALFLGSFFAGQLNKADAPLGFGDPTFAATTIVTKNISAAGITQFAASDGRRKFLQIQSQTSGTISCLLEGETATSASVVTSTAGKEVGFRIAGVNGTTTPENSTFQIRDYVGVVNCTSVSNATATVTTAP